MKTKSAVAVAIFFAGICTAALAGEKVEGNGWTKESAARAAEARARERSREKGTCGITHARLHECIQEKDGTWTCFAWSDNEGSCR
ncbi:hypothetical protein GJ699_25470 [Duganella sp. FT80W]|uniref:Uncharacterized protein n=1 Tax=Duganella guangzhouensis TaxID=2666084 RepID=A0A6I2L6C7_9BURK|nr:hypothetical protein [Duganella guangzhouensis]MRW93343.1 hypothetical protein [Duganella guangzhouensis]